METDPHIPAIHNRDVELNHDMRSVDRPKFASLSAVPNRRLFHSDASIILVGCRGAGKRTLGFIGATYLHRRLLIEDHYFEKSTGHGKQAFIETYGRLAYTREMTKVLAQVLKKYPFGSIIECGTSTLSPETHDLLLEASQTNPVIYVHRDKQKLLKLLGIPHVEAERLFAADQKHRDCTNLEYFNVEDATGPATVTTDSALRSMTISSARLLNVKEDFQKFLDRISGHGLARSWVENPFSVAAIPPEYRWHSYVLRIRLSDILTQEIDMDRLESGGDAVELIVDTWPDRILDIIAEAVALIRRYLDLPVILHVEENPREERQRTQSERDTQDLQLLLHGLHLGVEYLSLDMERNEELVARVLTERGRTKIIANFTMKGFSAPPWTDDIYFAHYERARHLGCISIVRFARFCAQNRDDGLRQALVDKVNALPDPKPHLVAFEYGLLGLLSGLPDQDGKKLPFQSLTFNPVGHEAIKTSPREHLATVSTTRGAMRIVFRGGHLQSMRFYVLGSKVYYSASPAMHRAAYDALMLPHSFDARQCNELEDVDWLRSEPDFGGACLTAPFKVSIMSRVDYLSPHATAIGATNILLPLRGATPSIFDHANARNRSGSTKKCYGDNTDWSSIMTCLRRAISPRNVVQPSRTTGLVIGAGGMARAAIYALIRLGCRKIFIYNRTKANADKVADHFNGWAKQQRLVPQDEIICRVLHSLAQPWPQGYQQPTMILSCIAAAGDFHDSTVEFQMPTQWLESPTGGVVVELAYEPLITALITQMRRIRDAGGSSWVIVDGLEVVCEMAMEAFELLTGLKAPRTVMRRACNETWEKNCAPFEARR